MYKGRIVLRGKIVKDDSGTQYFLNKDRVVLHKPQTEFTTNTKVKMGDAPMLLKIPKSECLRLPKHKWPKSWSSMEDQSFFLTRICTIILWQDCNRNDNLTKSY